MFVVDYHQSAASIPPTYTYTPYIYQTQYSIPNILGQDSITVYLTANNGPWVKTRQVSFMYDAMGIMTDSISQIDSSGSWVNEYWWHQEMNGASKVTRLETKQGSGTQWQFLQQEVWQYNTLQNDTLYYKLIGNNSSWDSLLYITKEYNGNDLTELIAYQRNGTQWINTEKQTTWYQDPGHDTLTLVFIWNSFAWDSLQKIRNEYDAFPHLIKTETFVYDSAEWDNRDRWLYVRDSSQNVLEETYQQGNDTGWVNSTRITRQFDTYGMTNSLSQIWDSTAWSDVAMITIQYNGSPSSYHYYSAQYNSGFWEPIEDADYVYDSLGRIIYYSGSGFAGSSNSTGIYHYDSTGFLFAVEQYHTSMGGLTRNEFCKSYKPLLLAFGENEIHACENDSIQLNLHFDGGVSPYVLQWHDGGILDTTSDAPYYITTSGSEWLNVTINDAYGNSFSDSVHIIIQHPVVDLGIDTTICTTGTLLLYSPGNYSALLWQDGSTDTSFTAQYTGNDTMSYWLQVTDPAGCISTDSMNVYFQVCSGVDVVTTNSLNIFPNPAKAGSAISILSEMKIESAELKNVTGEIILIQKIQNQIKLPSSVAPGIYVLSIFFENDSVQQRRVVVY